MNDNGKKQTPEVIDLLWSDSESENEASTARNKKPSAITATTGSRKPSASIQNVNLYASSSKSKKHMREPLEEKNSKNSKAKISGSSRSTDDISKSNKSKHATEASKSKSIGRTFSVASYNIWFGPPHPEERMFALAQALLEKNTADCPLWFVGLQEVTPVLWTTLRPILESAGYRTFCQDFRQAPYGVAMAVLDTPSCGIKIIQHGFQPYSQTRMGRGFLHVRAQLPQSTKQVLFTTTHLESFISTMENGAAEREVQARELETFCFNHMARYSDLSLAFISGDLNWDDERTQSKGDNNILTSVLSSKEWKDSWFDVRDRKREALADNKGKVKKKDEPTCYTYDAKESPMLGGNLRRRFDRVLFRQQKGVRTTVEDIDLIGKEAISGLTYTKESMWNGRVTNTKVVPVCPSDHFGYVVSIKANGI